MPNPRIHYGNSTADGWRGKMQEIKAARKEFEEYYGMMTQYERAIAEKAIKEMIDQHGPGIIGSTVKELNAALEKFVSARTGIDVAKMRETNQWDAAKLTAEMNLIQARVDQAIRAGGGGGFDGGRPSVAAQLEAIYTEARRSGDKTKMRAAGEVFLGVMDKIPRGDDDNRLRANSLSRQAERELRELREDTPEIKAAIKAKDEAWVEYLKVHEEARAVDMAVNGQDPEDPFAIGDIPRAMRRVAVDRYTNEVIVYDADAPEVTGVYWKHAKEEESDNGND